MLTPRILLQLLLLPAAALLVACGPGAGPGTTETPLDSRQSASVPTYAGPAPRDADVQRYRINLWDNIKGADRCGQCHTANGQDPEFARSDDVNLAYDATLPLVDLSRPADARLVAKVRGGHNCWLDDPGTCAELMTRWVQGWAGDAGSAGEGGVRRIAFVPPPDRSPGNSRSFPADSTSFAGTVHPLLRSHCAGCHSPDAGLAIRPFFADANADAAYAAARSLLNLDDPANSRFVVRVGSEFHNCWSNSCSDDAAALTAAVADFAAAIPVTELDPDLVTSQALYLGDGIVASDGGRHEASAIALWQFKAGTGAVAHDTSGVSPALDLTLSGPVDWVGGWGLRFTGGKAQGSTGASRKLHQRLTASGEFSVELWAAPANVSQEDSRVLSYSGGTASRNLAVLQSLYNWSGVVRDDNADSNGSPGLQTDPAAEVAQATLQHLVLTYDPANGRQLYVNGVLVAADDALAGAGLGDWDDSFALVLGNEVSGDRAWAGTLRLAAIHERALTPDQVQQNFAAGVGERFFLLFGIAEQVQEPGAYIAFEVSRFDNWSYLFSAPFYIDLDGSPGAFDLAGLRLGINGREAAVAQAYANLDLRINPDAHDPDLGLPLAPLGTLVPVEKGPDDDLFFLTFDRLGSNSHVRLPAAPPAAAEPVDLAPAAAIGLRTFAAIQASFSRLTGVPRTNIKVASTWAAVRQQLPVVPAMGGFLSSHQMAVTQLAIAYCDALVDDSALRSTRFPGFAFTAPANSAFDPAGRDALLAPLLADTVHSGLASQPVPADSRAELDRLIDRLTVCGGSCPAGRTAVVAKATCAAAIGSATVLLH